MGLSTRFGCAQLMLQLVNKEEIKIMQLLDI